MTVRFLYLILVLSVSAFPARAQETEAGNELSWNGIPDVTLVHLISRPDDYDGRIISAGGYLHVRFEDSALYLSKRDGDYLEGANASWVTYSESCVVELMPDYEERPCREALQNVDGRYVTIYGRFVSGRGGHLGAFGSSIVEVGRVREQKRWYNE